MTSQTLTPAARDWYIQMCADNAAALWDEKNRSRDTDLTGWVAKFLRNNPDRDAYVAQAKDTAARRCDN